MKISALPPFSLLAVTSQQPPKHLSGPEFPLPVSQGSKQLSTASAPASFNSLASPSPALTFPAMPMFNNFPLNTAGAVGPNHVMSASNDQIVIQDRQGHPLSSTNLNSFWDAAFPGSNNAWEPNIVFDPYAERWIFVCMGNYGTNASSMLIAVSATADPTGAWFARRVLSDSTTTSFDQPRVGFNRNWIVVTGNQVRNADSNWLYSVVYAFDKSDVYANGSKPPVEWSNIGNDFTLTPALTYDPSVSTMYLMANYNGNSAGAGYLSVSKITGAVGSEQLTLNYAFPGTTNPWVSSVPQNFAPQLGVPDKIGVLDARMSTVVYRNGSLWAAHTVFVPPPSPTASAVDWWQVSPEGAVQQFGRLQDPNSAYFYTYPSLGVNQNGDLLVGYSRMTANQYASAAYAFRNAYDPPGTLRGEFVMEPGQGPYAIYDNLGINRWGEYSATQVDPFNDTDFWTIQQYAGPNTAHSQWASIISPASSAPSVQSSTTISATPKSQLQTAAASAGSLSVVQAQSNFNPNSGVPSITTAIATTAGNLLVAYVRQGSNATDNFTVTDNLGQTWTLAGNYNSFGSTNRSAIFYMANSAAVSSVTANYTTSGGVTRPAMVVYEIAGAATSFPVDAGPAENTFNTSQTSLTSAPLTTSNANDILLYAVDLATTQSGTNNSFVPGTGFAFAATGAANDPRQAVSYEIVSSLQTNLTTSMSWGTSAGSGTSEFIAFKAAPSGALALQSVSVSPSTVLGGQSSTGTVTLTGPAPSGGAVVNVSSNNAAAQVPAGGTVTVAAGATSATFTITTSAVSTSTPVTISGSYNGGTAQTASLTVNPLAVQSVSVNPSTVMGGQSSTGTVTLNGSAPSGGAVVNVSSNNAAAQVPAGGTVTVAAGATSATFTITTSVVSTSTPVTISASYNGGTAQTASLTVSPLAVQSVSLNPSTVVGGQSSPSSTGTVALNGPAPNGGALVNLSSDNAAAQFPAGGTVTVAANQTSATFSINTSTVNNTTQATISASYNSGTSKSAVLTINPVGIASPLSVVQAQQNFSNKSTTTLSVPIGTTAGNMLVAYVREGSNATDNFTVTDNLGQVWIQAGYNSFGSTERSGLYYMPNSAAVSSVTANFTTSGGVTRPGMVIYEISGAMALDAGAVNNSFAGATQTSMTSASLTTNNANDILLYAVDLANNQSGTNNGFVPGTGFAFASTGAATNARQAVSFAIVNSVQTNLTTSMSWPTGTKNGAGQFIAFKAAPPGPAALQSITMSPSTVTGSQSSTATIRLTSAAPSGGAAVTVSSDSAFAQVPAGGLVTVPAGSSSTTFTVTTSSVNAQATANISASYSGVTKSTALTINPLPTVLSVALNPSTVTGGQSSTATVTLTGAAPTGGATVSLSSDSASAQVPAGGTATIPAGSSSTTFTVTTSSVNAQTTAHISAGYNNSTQSAALTINPLPTVLSVAVNPSTVLGSQSSTATVTLTGAAPTGGATVSVSSDSASAQVPAGGTVTVPAGSSSTTFTVTTSSVSAQTTAHIAASYNNSTQSAALVINPPAVQSVSLNPSTVVGGQSSPSSTGTVTLNGPAPNGGAVVSISSNSASAVVSSASVTVAANQTSATFTINTSGVATTTQATISATYPSGTTKTATLTINPASAPAPLSVVQAQQNYNANSGLTSLTANIPTTQGNLLVAYVREGSNATDNFTVSDSAGQHWTLAAYNSFGSANRSAVFYMANSAAVSSVTANFTTSGGVSRPGMIVYEIAGAATSSVLDAGPASNFFSTNQTSLSSNALTTNSTNEILIYAVDLTANESGTNNSFVPGTGFAFPFGAATNTRQAVSYEIVSTGQTNVTTSMSWGTSSAQGSSEFVAFKGAATTPILHVTPRVATLTLNSMQQFNATVSPATWAVDGVTGGSPSIGTITSSGLYTAPGTTGTHTITATAGAASASATAYITNFPGIFTRHNDVMRTGQNLSETVLTPANVNSAQFGKVFTYPLDGYVYGEPLYVPNVAIPGQGTHNVIYVVTEHDSVFAFDADGLQSTPLWQRSFINPAAGLTTIPYNDFGSIGTEPPDIVEVGITSTPVIDPSTSTIYVEENTKLVSGGNTTYTQHLHALDMTTGADKFGGPVLIQAQVSGTSPDAVNGVLTFQPLYENQRQALLLLNGVVYLGFGAHQDLGPWHGWVLGYNASTLQQVMVYNATANGTAAGIWQSGCGPAADANGNFYVLTGNGSFDTSTPRVNYGESVLKLTSSGTVADFFTPSNFATLNTNDSDLASSGAVVLPDQPGNFPHLLVTSGKQGNIYLLNRDSLGQYSPSSDNVVQEIMGVFPNGYWSSPAYWNSYVYFAPDFGAMRAYQLSNGRFSTTPASVTVANDYQRGTPAVSANGSSNGIVWVTNWTGDSSPGILRAYDATNLANLLYDSTQAGARDTLDTAVKFSVPTVANGRVYLGMKSSLVVLGLLP